MTKSKSDKVFKSKKRKVDNIYKKCKKATFVMYFLQIIQR